MGGIRRVGALALTAVLGLSLVACGGSSKTDTSGDAAKDAAVSADLAAGAFGSSDCAAFVGAFVGASSAIGSAFSGTGDTSDLKEVADYFNEVTDKLPKDIRADFMVFAEAYSDFAAAMADLKIDFSKPESMNPEALAKLEELGNTFEDPKVKQASERVEAYIDAECGSG